MGIKMGKAILIGSNNIIKISEATDEMRKQKLLKCSTDKCSAKLTWVKSSKINAEIVPGFFRLLNNEKHILECEYNIKGNVERIVRQSDSDVIGSIDNEKYEFRLNLIYEALNEGKKNNIDNNDVKNIDNTLNIANVYKKSNSKKTSYLSTMNSIMKLKSKIEDGANDKELSSLIVLDNKGEKIRWSNFYNYIGEEEKLFKYIYRKGKNIRKGKKLTYPICIEGIINKNIKEIYKSGDNPVYSVKYKQPKYKNKDDDGKLRIYSNSLLFSDKELVDYLNKIINDNKEIYIVAYFLPFANIKDTIYYNINGFINRKEQLIIID